MNPSSMFTSTGSSVSGSLSQSSALSRTLSWLLIFLILAGGYAYSAGVG